MYQEIRTETHSAQKKSTTSRIWWLVVLLFLIIFLLVGYYLIQNRLGHASQEFEPLTQEVLQELVDPHLNEKVSHKEPIQGLLVGMQRTFVDHVEVKQPTLVASLVLNPGMERGLLVEYLPPSLPEGEALTYTSLSQGVEDLTQEPLDFILGIDFDKVRPLVELLGPLSLQVPGPLTIDQEDYQANERLYLSPRQVMQVIKPEQSIERDALSRQQLALLDQIGRELVDWQRLIDLPHYLQAGQASLATSLTFDDLTDLLKAGYFTKINYIKYLSVDEWEESSPDLDEQIQIIYQPQESK